MSDKCPYCEKIMQKGFIHSDRYALKWVPEETDKGNSGPAFVRGVKLTNFEWDYIRAYYCDNCQKMILDINR